ncbi:hypothetical protein R1sor_027290 [Riccia sorocarpa]|uniref:Uncharacterized protein n=1 Tax=Riccia sorocarpa TaxID=122646 RepID=A0ABD3GDS2_9MARC
MTRFVQKQRKHTNDHRFPLDRCGPSHQAKQRGFKLKAPVRDITIKHASTNQQKRKLKAPIRNRAVKEIADKKFPPRVGRRPDPQSQYSAPLISRVSGIEKKIDLRKRARKVIEKEELDQCSFWPQTNSNSEYLDLNHYKPIEERALEFQRRREAKLAMARALEDQEKGLTFRPEINPKSVRIFKQTGLESIDIADRLTAYGSLHADKGSAVRPQTKDECTFTPEINSNTDVIIRASKMLEGCEPDFFSRQQVWKEHAEKKKVIVSQTSCEQENGMI